MNIVKIRLNNYPTYYCTENLKTLLQDAYSEIERLETALTTCNKIAIGKYHVRPHDRCLFIYSIIKKVLK